MSTSSDVLRIRTLGTRILMNRHQWYKESILSAWYLQRTRFPAASTRSRSRSSVAFCFRLITSRNIYHVQPLLNLLRLRDFVYATAPPSSDTSATATSASGDDEQSATTLNPAVIATGFAEDGQQVPTAGQVASLTSKNNFINFCLTVNKPITNGKQVKTGSCNPAPMGVIAATTNMPSSKFQNPKNGDIIKADQTFTVQMAVSNLETGNLVNEDTNFYAAPQQVNAQGNIIGHSNIVIEQLDSLNQTTPTDPNRFAFSKGISAPAVNGVLSADIADGLPAGFYRLASINSAANLQPVLVAVAQHGSLDDMVYFTVA